MSSTTIRWDYHPSTLFEAPFESTVLGTTIIFRDGSAIATFSPIVEPLTETTVSALTASARRIIAARSLLTHKAYELSAPTISYDREDGTRSVSLTVGVSEVVVMTEQPDIVARDASGTVIHDSKAMRIAMHDRDTEIILTALERHPDLQALVDSYLRAVADPADEFVHLYEVRDGLGKLLGGETGARTLLGISKAEWQQLGRLANAEPIDQGRHRGQHLGNTRPATAEELEVARSTVRTRIVRLSERWQA
jgi:hypothetical protein